jgi:hypothetical protein
MKESIYWRESSGLGQSGPTTFGGDTGLGRSGK